MLELTRRQILKSLAGGAALAVLGSPGMALAKPWTPKWKVVQVEASPLFGRLYLTITCRISGTHGELETAPAVRLPECYHVICRDLTIEQLCNKWTAEAVFTAYDVRLPTCIPQGYLEILANGIAMASEEEKQLLLQPIDRK